MTLLVSGPSNLAVSPVLRSCLHSHIPLSCPHLFYMYAFFAFSLSSVFMQSVTSS